MFVEMIGPAGREFVERTQEALYLARGYVYAAERGDTKDESVTTVVCDVVGNDDVIAQVKSSTVEELEEIVDQLGLDITLSNYSRKKEKQAAIIDVLENRE